MARKKKRKRSGAPKERPLLMAKGKNTGKGIDVWIDQAFSQGGMFCIVIAVMGISYLMGWFDDVDRMGFITWGVLGVLVVIACIRGVFAKWGGQVAFYEDRLVYMRAGSTDKETVPWELLIECSIQSRGVLIRTEDEYVGDIHVPTPTEDDREKVIQLLRSRGVPKV